MTGLCLFICGGVATIGIVSIPPSSLIARLNMILFPALLILGGALFMVRGYSLNENSLIVHRLGWLTRVRLTSPISAVHDPSALEGSLRVAGNGGLFAFSGLFHNKKLGSYRVFGTDPKCAVILRFDQRVIVVTPHHPEAFVEAIMRGRR